METDAVAPNEAIHPRAAFQHRDFRHFQAARVFAILGWQMQITAIGYQIYSMTGRALDLGYVGLAFFLPNLLLSLVSGHTADRFDRRLIMLLCFVVLLAGSLALFAIALTPGAPVWWIYATLVITGSAHAFYGPASQALMPQLVPDKHFANAVAWNSTIWQAVMIVGPASGGFIYDFFGGPHAVYAIDAACSVIAFSLILTVRMRTGRMETAEASWQTVLAGLRFIWDRKIVLGAISMDLFAVLFGGATALLPVYAKDILQVGETGFGVLRSAPAVGAALTAIAVAHLPPMKRAGATMMWCVAGFGVATIVFGVSKNFYISVVALFIMGATDMVSVIIRHTLVQVLTPPSMRGRVAAVNIVFIGASNELGDFESGVVAHWVGVVRAVVIGGIGTILVVGAWAGMFPQLRKFKRLDTPHAELEDEPRMNES